MVVLIFSGHWRHFLFIYFFNLWLCWVLVAAHGLSSPKACGILVPRPGIKPTSPALEGDP